MKFPRNARITKGSLEAAPWAAVMFLLVMFIMLGQVLYTPGVHIELPVARGLPGTDKPTVSVAMDANGQFYFKDQPVTNDSQLLLQLSNSVAGMTETPTLVMQVDKHASYENLVRLTQIARAAGIENALLATLPGPFSQSSAPVRP